INETRKRLHSQVGDVDVDAGVDIVKEIPTDVVGILVHDEIIGAIPAPIGADRPIPGSDFKAEATGEPETMMFEIEAFDAIAVGRAKVLEAAMLVGMVDVEALIVGAVVAVPMVVVDMGSAVDAAIHVMFGFGLGARCVLRVFFRVLSPFFRMLGNSGQGYENCDSNWE